jgi:DNA polymerase-1
MFEMFQDDESELFGERKLLLFDGTYSMFRAFYGFDVERFKTGQGVPNNCIYGVSRTLIAMMKQEKPTHLAFAYDVSRAGHRRELLPQYKEGRAKTPDELLAQFPHVKELLRLAKVAVVEQERLEADDIIATLATRAAEKDWTVRIFSSDKDMYQLVTERVNIIRPRTGQAGFDIITPEVIRTKYGVEPHQYPELAALVGEGADNIPGVPGIGPKTALKLICEYGDLDNLLNQAGTVTGKVGEALQNHTEQVKLNRQVNQLLTQAELSVTLKDTLLKSPPLGPVNDFLFKWEMPSLVNRFKWG